VTTVDHPPIDAARSLGELVKERPARARVFEAAGLDYCCRGKRSLAEAAGAAGLQVDAVIADLESVVEPGDADVDALGPAELVDHIESTHHAYLHQELPAVEALATKVAGVHGARHPELARVAELVIALRADLEPHLAKEEQVLFPAIRRMVVGPVDLPFGSISNPIRVMMTEHEAAGEVLGELRSVTNGFEVPADGCASYQSLYERLPALEADTFRHIHLENNVLFPAVEELGQDA
jgi:regulator of cell morphogenesis and NO signaling